MLKLMNLDPNELIEKNVFPKAAFFRGDEAEEFFEYIKSNNVGKVVQMHWDLDSERKIDRIQLPANASCLESKRINPTITHIYCHRIFRSLPKEEHFCWSNLAKIERMTK